jgi:hypothetical protein
MKLLQPHYRMGTDGFPQNGEFLFHLPHDTVSEQFRVKSI